MGKKIEGLWDCPYCDTKGIGGLTKHCPSCGHPQDADTQFYLPSKKTYLDEETAEKYGKGADWTCSYCGSLNRYYATECSNCGASREESSGDYNDNKRKRAEAAEAQRQKEAAAKQAELKANRSAKSKKRLIIFLAVLAAIIAAFAILLSPKNVSSEVLTKSWDREIQIEKFTTIEKSDWELPPDGRLISQQKEIHHYDKVIDHYKDVQVKKSRSVQDGYSYDTQYIDNGDGTFSEQVVSNPKYKTEYYYETVQEPVYRDDPVYYTKYYYEIDGWMYDRSVETQGEDDEPYWGEVTLADDEREGPRLEIYRATFSNGKNDELFAAIPFDLWETLKIGDKAKLVVQTGQIRKINNVEIN